MYFRFICIFCNIYGYLQANELINHPWHSNYIYIFSSMYPVILFGSRIYNKNSQESVYKQLKSYNFTVFSFKQLLTLLFFLISLYNTPVIYVQSSCMNLECAYINSGVWQVFLSNNTGSLETILLLLGIRFIRSLIDLCPQVSEGKRARSSFLF